MPGNPEEEKKKINWVKISIWSSVALVVIAAGIIVGIKIYKKKKDNNLDE